MKARVFRITLVFSFLLVTAAVLLSLYQRVRSPQDIRSEQIVAVNEISQLMKDGNYDLAAEKADAFQDDLRGMPLDSAIGISGTVMCGLTIAFMAAVFGYVYINILRPFDKMKDFAAEIAKGNFDIPLNYERSNYFGAFTWAFDSMRREITRSRACEREAVENNKTVIATLSHDIKTPIASIRAYAEGLEANLDTTPERRTKYLSILMRKCDEVSSLTNDLFLHSLSDLNKLKMQPEDIELTGFLEQVTGEMAAERGDVFFRRQDHEVTVSADKKRFTQLVENLINNARKYAKTDISIFITQENGFVQLHFCDTGSGIPDEDMPFITDKFYRGHNCGSENGSGLGLYIVRYIAEQSGGKLTLRNRTKGLEAIVSLPIKKTEKNFSS